MVRVMCPPFDQGVRITRLLAMSMQIVWTIEMINSNEAIKTADRGKTKHSLIMMSHAEGTPHRRSLMEDGLNIYVRYCGQMNSLYHALNCELWAHDMGMGRKPETAHRAHWSSRAGRPASSERATMKTQFKIKCIVNPGCPRQCFPVLHKTTSALCRPIFMVKKAVPETLTWSQT